MFVNHRTQGFILKKVDRGEANQLFTIYTEDFGKLEILAKAIRKISSKLRSGTEIFYLSEIEFIQGKTQKTLTDAILIDKFENLRKDFKKLKIAHKIVEVFDILIQGQEKDEKIWNLLTETFVGLNSLKFKVYGLELLYYYFFWNLLSVLGYEPHLYKCASCQKKLGSGKLFFGPKEGGVICQKCFKELKLGNQRDKPLFPPSLRSPFAYRASEGSEGEDEDGVLIARSGKEITPETIKILRIVLKKDWLLLSKLRIEKLNLKSLDEVASEFYSYIRPSSRA